MEEIARIGVDENGLGARLGPLIVTAVLARVSESGVRRLARKLPARLRTDLADSKRLVAHGSVALGEAWARSVCQHQATTPNELLKLLALEPDATLKSRCGESGLRQCWGTTGEAFEALPELVARVDQHLATLAKLGITVVGAKSSIICTEQLNRLKAEGKNRFVSDLHAMERLVLSLRESCATDIYAVCGKVGGMGDYARYFGPLAGRLHTVVTQERRRSGYRFPGLGEVHFVQDADASDPLVMLASLIGKYVRELLMSRVNRYYGLKEAEEQFHVSGYNDPRTERFVRLTLSHRSREQIPEHCFERHRDVCDS